MFDIDIDPLRRREAAARVMEWVVQRPGHCRYVVTPNLDHLVLLRRSEALRAAYQDADLVTPDGMPLVWASRLLGRPLPERVTGADLVPALFDLAALERPLRVFLLGAGPGVALQAAANIQRQWPAVRVVGSCSPPRGFEHDDAQNASILAAIADADADVVVVGLGAPKQECWVHQHQHAIAASAALCVGATIDFLAGAVRRAPRWMQAAGMEWLYRLSREPRRLAGRYLRDGLALPRLLLAEIFASPTARTGETPHFRFPPLRRGGHGG